MPAARTLELSRVSRHKVMLLALALSALGVGVMARPIHAGSASETTTDRTRALVAAVADLQDGAVQLHVNLYSGNLFLEVGLFHAAALGPDWNFSLFHNSRLAAEPGPLGPGWRHSAMISLLPGVPASNQITVRWADGRRDVFTNTTITPIWDGSSALEGTRITALGPNFELRTKHGWTWSFDAGGRLVSMRDRLGHGFAYAYDGSGRLMSQTDDAARALAFHYDGAGTLVSVDGLAPRPMQFSYDGLGRLVSTDALVQPIEFGSLADGRIAGVRFESQEFAIEYFPTAPAVVRTVRAPGARRDFLYDGDSLKTVVRDSVDAVTQYDIAYTFDVPGRILRVDAGGLGVSACAYGTFNRPLDYTAADGTHWLYEYDARGNLARFEDPTGAVQQFTWNPNFSLLTSMIDAASGTWTFDRFPDGNLQRRTDPLGHFDEFAYDGLGRLGSHTDALTHATTFSYTPNSDVASITDPLGFSRSFTYDARGHVLTATDEETQTWTFTRDGLDRIIICTPPESLGTTSYTYTPRGRLASIEDPLGFVTGCAFDPLDRVTSLLAADGGVWQFQRDGAGRVRVLTDPTGFGTQYQYDAPGRMVRRVDPIGATDEYHWSLHQLQEHVDPLGQPHQFEYTPRGEKKKLLTPGGPASSYQYDAPGRLIRAERTVPGDTTIAYDYVWDSAHRLLQTTQAPFGRVTDYIHDAAGRLIQVSDNLDPNPATYAYDDRGQLVSLTAGAAGTVSLSHTPRGQPALLQYPGGTSSLFEYDAPGQLEQQTNSSPSLFARYQVTHDTRGAPMRVAANTPAAGLHDADFAQDPVGRLAGERHIPTGEITQYTLDFYGSRTSSNSTIYAYDFSHRLLSTSGGLSKTWNTAGRVIEYAILGDTTRFQYRADGSLAGATQGAQQWSFSQGPFGELVHVRYPDASERWSAFDQAGSGSQRRADYAGLPATWSDTYFSVLDEQWVDISGLRIRPASARPLGYVVSATPRGWRPLLYDASGNVAQTVTYSGELIADRYYSAFGDVLASLGSTSTEPGFKAMDTFPGLDEFRFATLPSQWSVTMPPTDGPGALVAPTTRQQYNGGRVPTPFQLFSHSDQVSQFESSVYSPRTGLFFDRPLPDPVFTPDGGGGAPSRPWFQCVPIQCSLFAPLGGSCVDPLPSGLSLAVLRDWWPFAGPQDGKSAHPPPPPVPPKKPAAAPPIWFDPIDDPAAMGHWITQDWFRRQSKMQWTDPKPYTWP